MSGGITVGQPGGRVPGAIPRHLLTDLAQAPGRRVDPVVQCGECGAGVDGKVFALCCRSCGAVLTLDSDLTERARPDGLLPFEIDENTARAAFATWVSSRRFAPRTLKGAVRPQSIAGVFLPFWAFSTTTDTGYVGERGENRSRQVPRSRTNANGEPETYWETEFYTEWYPAVGRISNHFSNMLLPACSPLAEKIPPWPLERITPYLRGAASGMRVIAYDVEPEHGFSQAAALMREPIERAVHDDIGGDRQRVRDVTTSYLDPACTLLLLPAWLLSYVHEGRTWSVLVNGASGEVVGDRPYSGTKISALIGVSAVAAVVITAILLLWH